MIDAKEYVPGRDGPIILNPDGVDSKDQLYLWTPRPGSEGLKLGLSPRGTMAHIPGTTFYYDSKLYGKPTNVEDLKDFREQHEALKQKIKGLNYKVTCSICLEDIDHTSRILPKCKHIFHEQCIKAWCSQSENRKSCTCPFCRQPI